MSKKLYNRLALTASLLLILHTCLLVLGWRSGFSPLKLVSFESVPMSAQAGFAFALAGVAIWLNHFKYAWAGRLQLVALFGILLLSGAALYETLFNADLGIDWIGHYQNLEMPLQNVGRMSPNSIINFLLFSSALFLNRWSEVPALRFTVRLLTWLMVVLALFSLAFFFLKLEYIYTWIASLKIAFVTVVANIVSAIGLWTCWDRSAPVLEDDDQSEVRRIYLAAALVVGTMALAISIASFAFLYKTVESESSQSLLTTLKDRITLFNTVIDHRTHRAMIVSSEEEFTRLVKIQMANRADSASEAHLHRIAEGLLQRGFSAIVLDMPDQKFTLAGQLLPAQTFTMMLDGAIERKLMWHKGYFLQTRFPIPDSPGSTLHAALVTEQPLEVLDKLRDDINRGSKTGEMPVCKIMEQVNFGCIFVRDPIETIYRARPKKSMGSIDKAWAGETGVEMLIDPIGARVISAHGPIGDTGLGMVWKQSTEEIFTPVRQQLKIALPFMAGLVLFALLLMRTRLKPLTQKLAESRTQAKLEHARFVAAMENSPDSFYLLENIYDANHEVVDVRFVYLNRQAQKAFAHVSSDLTGAAFSQVLPSRQYFLEKYLQAARSGEMLDEEFSWDSPEAGARCIHLQVVPLPKGLAVTRRDLTEKRKYELLAEESNRLRSVIVENASCAIISTGPDGIIKSFNQAAERMLGYRADEVVGRLTPQHFHDDSESLQEAEEINAEYGTQLPPGGPIRHFKATRGLSDEREWTHIRKDGTTIQVMTSITALRNAQNEICGFLGVSYDITEQKKAAENANHFALHDVLTGLPNRALLDERVTEAINRASYQRKTFSLGMIDIDHFKEINDTLGHLAGDQLLIAFVERIKTCIRPGDTLARMGGDEFILVLPETSPEGSHIVGKRIVASLRDFIDIPPHLLQATASIGFSTYPYDGQNLASLLHSADIAMYAVKQNGRNGFRVYADEMAAEKKQAETQAASFTATNF